MGFFPETWAVIGMLADKDVAGVVRLLKDRVDHWVVASLPGLGAWARRHWRRSSGSAVLGGDIP
jgi:dihydrofolate synthase/folylpolyglutamate synthase